jgi:hypothetical protein
MRYCSATHKTYFGTAFIAIIEGISIKNVRKYPHVLSQVGFVSTIIIRKFVEAHLLLANKKNQRALALDPKN